MPQNYLHSKGRVNSLNPAVHGLICHVKLTIQPDTNQNIVLKNQSSTGGTGTLNNKVLLTKEILSLAVVNIKDVKQYCPKYLEGRQKIHPCHLEPSKCYLQSFFSEIISYSCGIVVSQFTSVHLNYHTMMQAAMKFSAMLLQAPWPQNSNTRHLTFSPTMLTNVIKQIPANKGFGHKMVALCDAVVHLLLNLFHEYWRSGTFIHWSGTNCSHKLTLRMSFVTYTAKIITDCLTR